MQVPQAEELDDDKEQLSPPGFHLVFLPFSDDIRNVPKVRMIEPEPVQVDAAKKVIKKLRMKTYHPEAFENPDLQAQFAMIEGLALQRDDVEMGEGKCFAPQLRVHISLVAVT